MYEGKKQTNKNEDNVFSWDVFLKPNLSSDTGQAKA